MTESQISSWEFSPEPSPGLLLPTWDGHTVMWGWEWYQPTTLMGRPVISANLCGGQGAFGTNRQRKELYVQRKELYVQGKTAVLKGFPIS